MEKACRLIAEASQNGARLVVILEAFIPTSLTELVFTPWQDRLELATIWRFAGPVRHLIPVPTAATLCQAAQDAGIHVLIGVNERTTKASGGSRFNMLIY